MRICIIGGGNLAHSLVATLGHNGNEVTVLTSRFNEWSDSITDITTNPNITGKAIACNSYEACIPKAELILITVPAFLKAEVLLNIKPYFNPNSWIGAFPGGPSFDLLAKQILGENTRYFASQRVPYICRVEEYGKTVNSFPKDAMHLAISCQHDVKELVSFLKDQLSMEISSLDSFLQISISNSNPILHPSRLYSLFHNYKEGTIYPKEYLFYEEWDDYASELLISMDNELQHIVRQINISTLQINTITKHYGVVDVPSMTRKITSIESFKNIYTPMVEVDGGYLPDFNSRYFTEDFCFGLLVLKDYAQLFEVATPTMDKVIEWGLRNSAAAAATKPPLLAEFGIQTREDFYEEYIING